MLRWAAAADHGGYELKNALVTWLQSQGHTVHDFGTHRPDRVDFPDFARPVALALQQHQAEMGLLCCGSGLGVTMAANRFQGVRAVLLNTPELAALAKQHNNANTLCFGGRLQTFDQARQLIEIFLAETFLADRYTLRNQKLDAEGAA